MTDPVRLVVAGVGLVGRRHVQAIRHLKDVDVVAVVDPSDAGKDYADERAIPWFSTLASMFDQIAPDGVVLSTPTPLHVEQGLECVANGCPALIEKPMATSAMEATALARAARDAKVPLLVGHHRRHNPLIQKAKDIIDNGEIGSIRSVHSNCWFYKPDAYFDDAPWRKKMGAGPVSVNLVHDVDLIRYLCGEVTQVQAQSAPSSRGYENEEVAAAVLRFETGAIGTITVSDSIVSPWSWELTAREYPIYPATSQSCYMLGGSHGSLSVPDLTLWNNSGERDWWEPIRATIQPRAFSDPLVNQIEHFCSVIRDGTPPLVSATEGLRTLQVIEAIQNAATSGETVTIQTPEALSSAPDLKMKTGNC